LPEPTYTDKQGQYLAFIHQYTKVNGVPPAQADMQRYFKVTPPSVHAMVVQLERKGFISRESRTPRSLRILLTPEELPALR